MFCEVCDECGYFVQYPEYSEPRAIECPSCGNQIVGILEARGRATIKFIQRHLWLKEMWKDFEKIDSEYWTKICELNEKYTEIAKNNGLECVSLWSGEEDGICGIDVNDGYGTGGYNFSENKMLIHDTDLWEKEK